MNRAIRFWWQRRTRGFDDSELWSLDYTIIKFMLPRLKAFKDFTYSFSPDFATHDEWKAAIQDMIDAFEIWMKHHGMIDNKEELEKFNKGYKLFTEQFFDLWS